MINNYNNYVKKEILQEKVDINLKNLVRRIKEEINKSKSAVVYSTITKDGEPVKVDGEYYALFYTQDPNTKDRVYSIGKVKILKKIEKSIEGSDKKTTAYIFKLLDINPFLEGKENLTDYKIYKSDKAKIKLSDNEITGFYLYDKEKTPGDIKSILKRYGIQNKEQGIKEPDDVEVGSVYEVTNSKGNRVKIGILDIRGGQVTARDFDNKNDIKNLKLDNIKDPKYVGTLYDILKPKAKELETKNWAKSDEYKKLNSEEKAKFIQDKIDKLNKIIEYTNGSVDSRNSENNISLDVKEDIKQLRSSVKGMITLFQQKIKNIQEKEATTAKPKEPVEDKTETKEEKEQKVDVEKMDKKAKEVQTEIQKPVEKKPVKQKVKKEEKPIEVKEEKPEMQVASKNYNEFIDGKIKKL